MNTIEDLKIVESVLNGKTGNVSYTKLPNGGVAYNVSFGSNATANVTSRIDPIAFRVIPYTWYNRLGWYKVIDFFKKWRTLSFSGLG